MRLSATMTAAAVTTALGLLALGGCNREAGKAARTDAQATASASSQTAGPSPASATRHDDGPAYTDGKPTWAASRQRSADAAAQRQFDRNGKDFGAGSLDDYIAKAHAFVDSPPRGALTATRSNGDTLYYDPKANVFAVADRRGAPRTMFKPTTGRTYWDQQVQRLNQPRSRRGGGADSGGAADSSG